jgi:uncharacterized protein (DUF305 family)
LKRRGAGATIRNLVRLSLAALAAGLATACYTTGQSPPPLVQPGSPGEPSRVITATEAAGASQVAATAADIKFMQGMIRHHMQALQMTALLPSRTAREDMRLLARRIELSQADEIRLMQRWLDVRGAATPEAHTHEGHGPALMPGMLTPEEMDRLAAARGGEFDRLFLALMIKHHDGALVMVEDLFATEAAGQEAEVFAFATDVDADQRIEIDRMSAMLLEMPR